MPAVTYVDPDGTERSLVGDTGMSVMEIAVRNGVNGIEADCGGACACATCHIYVDDDWMDTVGAAEGDEAEMLEFAVEPRPSSRLACQIRLSDALDGLRVTLPLSQH